MRDLPHNRLIRPRLLLRRKGPVPGILATGGAGAMVDKSERRSVKTLPWPSCGQSFLAQGIQWL
jgi:hypothetical protein